MSNPVPTNEASRSATGLSASSETLPARLDSAIEETSAGIGMMIADVVRKSLVGGVSDIERTLTDYVAERVDASIDAHMPVFAEAAHRVAESTSTRLVKTAVTESERRAREELQTAVSSIEQTVDQTRQAIEQSVDQTRLALEQTKLETQQRVDDTLQNINQLTERSQSSWKRVKGQFEAVGSRIVQSESQLTELNGQLNQLKADVALTAKSVSEAAATSTARMVSEASARSAAELQQALAKVNRQAEQDRKLAAAEMQAAGERLKATHERTTALLSQCAQLTEQNRLLQERIAELEKPKGLKGLWHKMRGRGGKAAASSDTEDSEYIADTAEIDETEESTG